MLTLTYGRKKPQTNDPGSTWFPALEDNIDKDDAHTHDGVTSPQISHQYINKGTIAVTGSGYSASGDLYRKSVALPSGFDMDTCTLMFKLNGGSLAPQQIFPKFEKIDSTNFYLYMPTSSQAVDVMVI